MRQTTRIFLGGGACILAMGCNERTPQGTTAPAVTPLGSVEVGATSVNAHPSGGIPAATVRFAPVVSRAVTAAASLLPATFNATLAPGDTAVENKTAIIPATPPLADIVFSLDLTGSMGGELNNMKVNAVNIMNAIAGVIPNTNYGVISYEDYAGVYTTSIALGHACNYTASYGSIGVDSPYRLSHALATDRSSVSAAISALFLGRGDDGPESYSRAFFETYAELIGQTNTDFGPIGWRPGAKKIIVNFEDNVPHDCDYDAVIGGSNDTGNDPGRDGLIGTADDLRILSVLNNMKANDVTLINLNSGGPSLNPLWDAYAAVTGGTNFLINADGSFPGGVDPATTIANLIQAEVGTVSSLTLAPCSGSAAFATWIKSVQPASYIDVALPATKNFAITYSPPVGTAPGTYTFGVCAVGDGVEYASQSVTIDVLGSGSAFTIDIEPEDPTNVVGLGGTRMAVAVLSTPTFDATLLVPATCRLSGGSEGIRPVSALARNVDKDGYVDLVLFFKIPALVRSGNLGPSTTKMRLSCKGGLSDEDVVVPK